MSLRRLITRLLGVLVIAGLVVAPLAAPASAMASSTVDMAQMASISGQMPCCPDEQKNSHCPDCPLASMCVVKVASAVPCFAESIPVRLLAKTAHAFRDDAPRHGLDRPPPDHPPRHLT
jgi:hypothetical protein